MKTRTYLLLFLAASLLVMLGAYLKIEHIEGGDSILGFSMLAQGVLIVAFLVQNLRKGHQ